MKVLVPIKRVVDANVKVRVKADGTGVELANWLSLPTARMMWPSAEGNTS